MKKYILSALFALLSTACFAQLPSVQIKDLKGKTINSATLSNDGKPFCICFFASWCKPCNRELKAIHEVYEEWQEETGMKIYAISIDQGQNSLKVKPFVDSEGWEYDILLDPNSELLHALGIQMIPHTLVLDGDGKIQYRHTSYQDGAEEQIIEEIRTLLAKLKQENTQTQE